MIDLLLDKLIRSLMEASTILDQTEKYLYGINDNIYIRQIDDAITKVEYVRSCLNSINHTLKMIAYKEGGIGSISTLQLERLLRETE